MSTRGKDTIESLTKEAAWLKEKLAGVEKRLEEKRKLLHSFKTAELYTPKKTFTAEWRPLTPAIVSTKGEGKRIFGDLVGEGKRRKKVGEVFDPEVERILGPVVGVKVGGVEWGVGIEGVLAGLEALGYVSYEGSHWLVGEEELGRRKGKDKTLSTVVAMVRGEKEVGALYRQGLWLAGRWHSVKQFVAVQPMRKVAGWQRVMECVDGAMKKEKKEVSGVHATLRKMRLSMERQMGGLRKLAEERKSFGGGGYSSGGFGVESFQARMDREKREFEEERLVRKKGPLKGRVVDGVWMKEGAPDFVKAMEGKVGIGDFGSGGFSFSGLAGGSGRGKVWDGNGKKPSWV